MYCSPREWGAGPDRARSRDGFFWRLPRSAYTSGRRFGVSNGWIVGPADLRVVSLGVGVLSDFAPCEAGALSDSFCGRRCWHGPRPSGRPCPTPRWRRALPPRQPPGHFRRSNAWRLGPGSWLWFAAACSVRACVWTLSRILHWAIRTYLLILMDRSVELLAA